MNETLDLVTAGIMALGWMMGAQARLGIEDHAADPVIMGLARALKHAGAECTYLDELLRKEEGRA